MDKTIKIKSFKCDEDLSKYKNSILFNSGTVIAEGVFTYGDEELSITLDVFGETRVIYKGEVYTDPDDFPEELTNLIKEHPYDWDVCAPSGEGNDDEETYADSNNWFDYSVGSNGEDYPYEKDLSAASSLDILNDMLEIAQKFFFEKNKLVSANDIVPIIMTLSSDVVSPEILICNSDNAEEKLKEDFIKELEYQMNENKHVIGEDIETYHSADWDSASITFLKTNETMTWNIGSVVKNKE